jgi:hypothetical protein
MAADFSLTFAAQARAKVPFLKSLNTFLSLSETCFEQNKTDFWALIEK